MLKHKGLKTFLTYSFLVMMMMINEAPLTSSGILAAGRTSEQLAPLISQGLISVIMMEQRNRKQRDSNERHMKGTEYK